MLVTGLEEGHNVGRESSLSQLFSPRPGRQGVLTPAKGPLCHGASRPSWYVGGKYPASLGLPSVLCSPLVSCPNTSLALPHVHQAPQGGPAMTGACGGQGSTSWPHRLMAQSMLANHPYPSLRAPRPVVLLAHICSLD